MFRMGILDPSPVEQCKHPVCPLVRPHRRGEIVQVGRGVLGRGVQELREARHLGDPVKIYDE